MTPHSSIIVAIAGGPAAGKKSVQRLLRSQLLELHGGPAGSFTVVDLHLHDFLKPCALSQFADGKTGKVDPERLEAYDLELLADAIEQLRGDGGGSVNVPDIDPSTGERRGECTLQAGADVIVVEGAYVLCSPRLVGVADVKIFVDSDPDVRLARRVVRDLEERSLPLETIFDQHLRHSKSSYELVILPTKQTADIILPGASIAGGVELIAQSVMDDVRSGRMRKGAGATEVVVHAGLDILSEADLGGGGVGYYETV